MSYRKKSQADFEPTTDAFRPDLSVQAERETNGQFFFLSMKTKSRLAPDIQPTIEPIIFR